MLDFKKIGEAALKEWVASTFSANSPDESFVAAGRAAVAAMIPPASKDGFCGDCPFKHWDEAGCHCGAYLHEGRTVGCKPGPDCPARRNGNG